MGQVFYLADRARGESSRVVGPPGREKGRDWTGVAPTHSYTYLGQRYAIFITFYPAEGRIIAPGYVGSFYGKKEGLMFATDARIVDITRRDTQ